VRDGVFGKRARGVSGAPLDGWATCLCGGRYTLDETPTGKPIVLHSQPTCERYAAIETNADAVRFSQENRAGNLDPETTRRRAAGAPEGPPE
jgi:hypothetical protein